MPTVQPVRAWAAPSSHGATTYEVCEWPDGSFSCDCPGWIYVRPGKTRSCKHVRLAAAGALPLAGADVNMNPPGTGGRKIIVRIR